MLDNLVESKSNAGENKREAGFLITTLFIVVALFLTTLTYSLFAKDLGMDDGGLELSTLVAPVIEAETPPEPEVRKQPEENRAAATESNVVMRREAFASIDRTTTPPADTNGQKGVQSWVKGAKIGPVNSDPSGQNNLPSRGDGEPGEGIASNNTSPEKEVEPPPMTPKPSPKPAPAEVEPKKEKPRMVTGGVVNGKATNLVKPQFSAAAKAVKASGTVNVQVVIDEKGNVISASAASGHQLLRKSAEDAARASKFTPTFLTGQPVKVTGVIVYNFVQ
ncbi:MAG: energy transducer TonB [Acidobacteriota bacterium]|nr:energy transducer TonB [Acidobacteriota bacterium]